MRYQKNSTSISKSSETTIELKQSPQSHSKFHFLRTYIYKNLLSIIILLGGFFLFYNIDRLITKNPERFGWLYFFPFKAFAESCLVSLILIIVFTTLIYRELEKKICEAIEKKINDQSKVFTQPISQSLPINKQTLEERFSSSEIEDLIRTGLQIKMKDENLGNDISNGLLRKVIGYEERWQNYRYKASLSLIKDDDISEDIKTKYFQAYIDLRYETLLKKSEFIFVCASTVEEFNKLIGDPSYQERWHFPITKEFPSPHADETAFNVRYFNVDGVDLNIRRELKPSENKFVIICDHPDLNKKLNSLVTIHYRYETKILKRGHLFKINLVCPTKGVTMELDFANTDIHYVNILDFFVSNENPIIRYIPSREKPHRVEVELNELILPKGGVAFVWVLKQEIPKHLSSK